jgi:hypothetical protein
VITAPICSTNGIIDHDKIFQETNGMMSIADLLTLLGLFGLATGVLSFLLGLLLSLYVLVTMRSALTLAEPQAAQRRRLIRFMQRAVLLGAVLFLVGWGTCALQFHQYPLTF